VVAIRFSGTLILGLLAAKNEPSIKMLMETIVINTHKQFAVKNLDTELV